MGWLNLMLGINYVIIVKPFQILQNLQTIYKFLLLLVINKFLNRPPLYLLNYTQIIIFYSKSFNLTKIIAQNKIKKILFLEYY